MSATNSLVKTLLAMTGQHNIITVPRAFVGFTRSLEAGMLLNQLLYWVPRSHLDGDAMFKTDADWVEELCLTRYAVRSARETLEAMGFLTTSVERKNGSRAVHYHIDYDELVRQWELWLQEQAVKSENARYSKGSKVRKRTLLEKQRANPDELKCESVLSYHYAENTTKITSPTPAPAAPADPTDDDDDGFFLQLRRRKIGQTKARQIAAMGFDAPRLLAAIDRRNDVRDPHAIGRIINDIIDGVLTDAPPVVSVPSAAPPPPPPVPSARLSHEEMQTLNARYGPFKKDHASGA